MVEQLSQHENLDVQMARLADGDRSAFTAVFRQLWEPTVRLCRSLVANAADADDAAQQAMEKVLSRAATYDASRPALPWALAIAAWECRTILRRRLRRRETSDEPADGLMVADLDDQVVHRDLVRAALVAIGALSTADRETMIATFWDEATEVTGAALRKRRQRALARLRDAFRRLYGVD